MGPAARPPPRFPRPCAPPAPHPTFLPPQGARLGTSGEAPLTALGIFQAAEVQLTGLGAPAPPRPAGS